MLLIDCGGFCATDVSRFEYWESISSLLPIQFITTYCLPRKTYFIHWNRVEPNIYTQHSHPEYANSVQWYLLFYEMNFCNAICLWSGGIFATTKNVEQRNYCVPNSDGSMEGSILFCSVCMNKQFCDCIDNNLHSIYWIVWCSVRIFAVVGHIFWADTIRWTDDDSVPWEESGDKLTSSGHKILILRLILKIY